MPRSGALEPITRTAAAGTNFGEQFQPRLQQARAKFAQELAAKPWLRQRLIDIMYNEQGGHPKGVQAVAESAMNRALVRGTSLEQQLRWHGAERGGYYQRGNMGRGHQRYLDVLNQGIENALNGSNIADYATDNSSGRLAAREKSTGHFRYRSGHTGESFFAPGSAEPRLARAWDRWFHEMTAPEMVSR
jgi:hypothetical protein